MKNIGPMAVTLALLAVLAAFISAAPQSKRLPDGRGGAFDVTRNSIRLEEIQSGGPPKDGIPSLTDPEFVSVKGGVGSSCPGIGCWVWCTKEWPRPTPSRF